MPKLNDTHSKRSISARTFERRVQIITILSMVTGIIIILSILSYSGGDGIVLARLSFSDIFRLPFNDEVKALSDGLNNRLGLVGAFIADLFINSTIGYASLVVPILMIAWSWVLLRKKEPSKLIVLTNYAIIFALLFSTAFGIANLIAGNLGREWSGTVGAFIADISARLLGKAGASIVVLTALFITVILAIDLDIRKSIDRLKTLVEDLRFRYTKRDGIEAQTGYGNEKDVMINHPGEYTATGPSPEEDPETGMEEPEADEELERRNGDELPAVSYEAPADAEATEKEESDERAAAEPKEIDYIFPSIELLDVHRQVESIPEGELKANAELVRTKLANFGIEIESVSVTPGPVVTLYELVPASTVKISRIVSLADDLALALAAKGIRIMAPIPGKSAVGVEIPNKNPSLVSLRSVLNSAKFRESNANLPLALGKTISGDVYTDDLAKMPHLLLAGSTGSGKSVGINTILAALLFKLHPTDVKFIIIDPKKIELALYAKLKYHFLAVSPDIDEEIITTPENAVLVLKSVESEMEARYDRLAAAGVRNIQDYNERFRTGRLKESPGVKHGKMPYLIVVIDELADLMLTAAGEIEEPIARLAQLSRAVGVHLVLATQRPSVDVITGVIKANFPARMAYQVASKTDSRTILDMNGAEQLLGSGDMLYLPSGSPKPFRIQTAFISTEEIERLTDHISRQEGYTRPFQLPSVMEKKRSGMRGSSDERDEFFSEAARLVVRHQQGSVSLLQRRLKVGYSRAARLIDELESAGIVGPFDGSKARLVLIDGDEQLNRILDNL